MKKLSSRSILFFVAVGCLYFAGVAAILYPMVSNILSLTNSREVISGYEEKVASLDDIAINSIIAKADKYNYDVSRHIYRDGYEKSLCDTSGLMCYVEVPSINVYLPVYYGTSNDVLQKGCGFVENTSLPIGGKSTHAVISGHTGLPSAEMLTKLDQVKKGEVFYIHVLDMILEYQIDKITVVTPDVFADLAIVENEDLVTLLTCTPYGINDKRLLVRGTRVPYEKPAEAETDTNTDTADPKPDTDSADAGLEKEISHQMNIVIAIIIAAVILYIDAFIWLVSSIKKKQASGSEEQDVTQETD